MSLQTEETQRWLATFRPAMLPDCKGKIAQAARPFLMHSPAQSRGDFWQRRPPAPRVCKLLVDLLGPTRARQAEWGVAVGRAASSTDAHSAGVRSEHRMTAVQGRHAWSRSGRDAERTNVKKFAEILAL
eukprot:3877675-Pleurochrysis_carterae.AAC.2